MEGVLLWPNIEDVTEDDENEEDDDDDDDDDEEKDDDDNDVCDVGGDDVCNDFIVDADGATDVDVDVDDCCVGCLWSVMKTNDLWKETNRDRQNQTESDNRQTDRQTDT